MKVTIKIHPNLDEVKTKIFSVDPNPKSKSMGYMVGYVQALEENSIKVEFVDCDKELTNNVGTS